MWKHSGLRFGPPTCVFEGFEGLAAFEGENRVLYAEPLAWSGRDDLSAYWSARAHSGTWGQIGKGGEGAARDRKMFPPTPPYRLDGGPSLEESPGEVRRTSPCEAGWLGRVRNRRVGRTSDASETTRAPASATSVALAQCGRHTPS